MDADVDMAMDLAVGVGVKVREMDVHKLKSEQGGPYLYNLRMEIQFRFVSFQISN